MDHQSNPNLSVQLTGLIEELEPIDLECIYLAGARIWIETSAVHLAITYGPPGDDAVHDAEMAADPSPGYWVWAGLEPAIAQEHPRHANGEPDLDWPGIADWARQHLLARVADIAEDLELDADLAFELLCEERMLPGAVVATALAGSAMLH